MNEPKPSILERLARKIEPPKGDLPPQSQGRMIKQLKDIPEAADVYNPGKPPKPTNALFKTLDGDIMRFHTDGSIRHAKSKEERRAAEKTRRHQFRVTNK